MPVRILFIDDEAIIRDVFRAKAEQWLAEGEFGDSEIDIEEEPQTFDDLQCDRFDIVVVDQLMHGKRGADILRCLDLQRQFLIIISQSTSELLPLYSDDRVIRNFERVILLPKSEPLKAMRTSGQTVGDLASVGWWDEILLRWIREMCRRLA